MAEEQTLTRVDRSKLSFRKIKIAAIRDATGKHAIDHENKRMWFRASTDQLCDDGVVIDAGAWATNMPDFETENCPFVDSHSYNSIGNVIGKPVAWEVDDIGLLLCEEFAGEDPHPFGRMAWYLASNGYVKAGSVAWSTLERKEEKTDGGQPFTRVTQARLEEFSLCVRGMDDKALALHGDPLAVAAIRAFNPGGGTEIIQTELPTFREIEGVDIETREGEPDRIGEILERLERIEAAVEDVDDLIAARITGVTITALAVEAERIDIDEPAWRKYIREVSADDDRSFDEVMADLRKHKP